MCQDGGCEARTARPQPLEVKTISDPCVLAGISKTEFRKSPRLTKGDVRDEAIRSWNLITQEAINNTVESMPSRLKAVIDNGGQKTQY